MLDAGDSPDRSFKQLLCALAEGDSLAATRIFDQFGGRLIALARTRMDAQIRQKVDPEDVVQSALRSFFVRQAHDGFELSNWDNLWSLLVCITLRKCNRKTEVYRAAMRDVNREVRPEPLPEQSRPAWEAIAREPTPEEVAGLTETVETLMQGLDETRREVVSLRLQGHTVPEISGKLSISERSVFRALARAREILEQMDGTEAI